MTKGGVEIHYERKWGEEGRWEEKHFGFEFFNALHVEVDGGEIVLENEVVRGIRKL